MPDNFAPRFARWTLLIAALNASGTAIRDARAASAVPSSVRLLTATPTAVRFEVEVPPASLSPLTGQPGVTRLELKGYELDARLGEPALPVRVVMVAVPPLGEVRVSATGSASEPREGLLLAALPIASTGQSTGEELYPRAAAYAAKAAQAPERARLLGVSWMRNQRVAHIQLSPAEYDPATRRFTLYRHLEVEVDVAPVGDLGPPFERSDPFEAIYRTTLINYEQGRAWRRPSLAGIDRRTAANRALAALVQPVVPETSIYAGRSWVKIAVHQTGFYKVDFGQVRNFSMFAGVTTTHVDSLRLFTWGSIPAPAGSPRFPGLPVLPEGGYCDSCDYREVAIGVVAADTLFNKNSDYFYFFALGPSDWENYYDPSKPDTLFLDNPYEITNYFYLTVGTTSAPVGGARQRIGTASGALTGGGVRPPTFAAREHFEQDNEYWPDAFPYAPSPLFWEKWYWASINNGGTGGQFSIPLDAPGADTTQPFRMRARVWGLSLNQPPFPYYKSIPDHELNASFNGASWLQRNFEYYQPENFDTSFVGLNTTGNVWSMSVANVTDPHNPYRLDRVGFAWLDLYYPRRFEPSGNALTFDSQSGPGTFEYHVGPFNSVLTPRVFDVTEPLAPFETTNPGSQFASDTLVFQATQNDRRRYRVITDTLIARVPNSDVNEAPGTSFENLRSSRNAADYLVIYFDDFLAAADTLAEWRKSRLPLENRSGPFRTQTVPISALYDQFSGGRTDPSAIRNFLRAVFYNWNRDSTGAYFGPSPKGFVTMLGDASYDFKNILGRAQAGQPGCLLPSYEGGYDVIVQKQFATDDWLLNVDNAAIVVPDFIGGRIPAGDEATAMDIVRNKVLEYERTAPLGEWRDKVMLIADDYRQGEKCDDICWGHIQQIEDLDTLKTPAHVDREYVFLHTYPTGPGNTKPGARADIFKNIDDGVLMFNFIGHGSPFKLADESVFLVGDAGTLTNASQLSVLVAASCDVGKYNDPNLQSLGERLLATPGGGTVGVISATELAFSGQNAELNQILYQRLFDRDTLSGGGQYHFTFSGALLAAKQGSLNNQKYQFMGDAATRPNVPRLWVDLKLEDTNGQPVTNIQRGQTLTFRGRVFDRPPSLNGKPVSFNGVASLLIEDSQPYLQVPNTPDCPECQTPVNETPPSFYFRAGTIYRGDVSVQAGQLTGKFVVPLDSHEGARGRVRAYLAGRASSEGFDSDGVGSLPAPVTPGVASGNDTEGPRITLSFAGGSTAVRPDATLRVDLFDQSGILTTAHTPQNSIIVTLDDNTTSRVDITDNFRYAADSYQAGTSNFQLPNLAPGAHRVTVSAADNLALGISAGQHRSSASLDFQVVSTPPLRIARAYLFPNPTSSRPRRGGQFVIDAPGDSINVLLRIYTVSGREVRVLTSFGGIGQVQIPWDGLDDEGQPLANGTYLFHAQANTRDPDGTSSPRQRAVADGKFVIVNH